MGLLEIFGFDDLLLFCMFVLEFAYFGILGLTFLWFGLGYCGWVGISRNFGGFVIL